MNAIVVTGATSGIGLGIAHWLIDQGYHVFGIGRDFSKVGDLDNFTPLCLDLRNPLNAHDVLQAQAKDKVICGLVNAAGFGCFAPLEDINPKVIGEMIQVNLMAPIVITQAVLPSLKSHRGFVINIASIEALRSARFATVYSATKAGLRAFTKSLFEEVRKSGVRLTTINPDVTDTPFFEKLWFTPNTAQKAYHLDVQEVVEAVAMVIKNPHCVVEEITLRAQKVGIVPKP